ncbi:VOC family protein [Ovoidimarina sediminis]|uniref:VOC family protein n=1 Tax=Ovoidimarina sediminis TaxID=3079856 RepID=UPI0029119648|nr:VOC family protein [Rhodophyticola sp. MJ-SS7]MDU8944553.1 VOC family protein [Rhodophyticola sp. MJ-SS7]
MPNATLEHVNITVSDPAATARWMERVFGWHVRWEGPAISDGYTVHVGDADRYVALYSPGAPKAAVGSSYAHVGGFNHLAIVVDDLDATERLVEAEGFAPRSHADYEPGRRFYFNDRDGIEVEVVSYD